MRELNASFYQFFFRLDALLLEYSWQGTCLFEMAAGRKNAYVMILCDKIRFWWCVRGGGGFRFNMRIMPVLVAYAPSSHLNSNVFLCTIEISGV